jgi:osmotically inducible protein OsmC
MIIRESQAVWHGSLKEGSGRLKLGSGVFEGAYSFPSRFESAPGTNPEELIAAAHAGCFTMALTYALGNAGHTPQLIRTRARVHLGTTAAGPTITRIELETEGEIAGLGDREFHAFAEAAKKGCLVSRALAGVPDITVTATLVESRAQT